MQQPKDQQPITAQSLYREVVGLREEIATEKDHMIRLKTKTEKLAQQVVQLMGGNSNGGR